MRIGIVRAEVLGAIAVFLTFAAKPQSGPVLTATNDSPTTMQIAWPNALGTTYRILAASALPGPWTPLEDAFSANASVSVDMDSVDQPMQFFQVEVPAYSGVPEVDVFSLTNGQVVSGTVAIAVGAQIGTQIMGVNFYLDGALIGYVDSGGAELDLDTTHFANGSHTLYVSAMGTDNNETASDPITLDFENPVRWIDASPLFQAFVPINVQSDIFPANWTVFVEDSNGVTVRTFSGVTSDGMIQTNWDGNDQNGAYAPDTAYYTVTVVVAASGQSSPTLAVAANSTGETVTPVTNRYGAVDYVVEQPAPNPAVLYSQTLSNYLASPWSEQILYPPFWLAPTDNMPAVIETRMSARQMYLSRHPAVVTSPASAQTTTTFGSSSSSTGTTVQFLWREPAWVSGETLLARQKLTGWRGLTYDGSVASLLSDIQVDVSTAATDLPGDRAVYQNSVLVMQHNGDFDQVRTGLASFSPNVRSFYFWGHGSPNGNSIGFEEGTPNDGLLASNVSDMLANYVSPPRNGQPEKIGTHKPFSFVFVDGCMTSKGNFPEAFGIPKTVPASVYNNTYGPATHRRAFMGWGGIVSFSILDSDHLSWSKDFWDTWLANPTGTTVKNAVDTANGDHPSAASTGMILIGSPNLTWSN